MEEIKHNYKVIGGASYIHLICDVIDFVPDSLENLTEKGGVNMPWFVKCTNMP